MGKFGSKKKEREQVVSDGVKINATAFYIGNNTDDNNDPAELENSADAETSSISMKKRRTAGIGQAHQLECYANPALERLANGGLI